MKKILLCLLITISTCAVVYAQADINQLRSLIIEKDSLFWQAYNSCATDKLGEFFSEDVEFYHDKGGITEGLTLLASSMKNNLCNNPDYHLRREAVPGTINVFPMLRSDQIYGAIISGDHYFYINETGKKERRDGLAKFTHLWLLKDGKWKMTRILSYDHRPAPYLNTRDAVSVAAATLKQLEGKYQGPNAGTITITAGNNQLSMSIGNHASILYPETASRFFMKERDITVEFVKPANGKPARLVVKENDAIVEEAPKISQ